MDMVLSIVIQTTCAAAVIYVLFRENFQAAAQRFERRIGTIILSAKDRMRARRADES